MLIRQDKTKMKIGLMAALMFLTGCSDNATTKSTVDSTLNKVDSAANAVWDSTKRKAKDIKESIDSTFKKKKDSID